MRRNAPTSSPSGAARHPKHILAIALTMRAGIAALAPGDLSIALQVGRVHFAEALSYRALVDEVRRAA
jgi:hypothetical protein